MKELNAVILIAYLIKISSCHSVVETTSGSVQSVDAQVDDVEAFLGIPYAEPPIGDLRFAKPVPIKPWTETYVASSLPPPCMQPSLNMYSFLPDTTNMSEDCLYLNIWKPKAKPNGFLRPIVIYIHFGAFVIGSSNQKVLDGSHFASQADAVVVTFNYRLGCFGFLLANIKEADGNMGAYDQIMAIKWVKDNAKHFGGDPDNITLMGTSAGGQSISAHLISPLSKNLFRRAIITSGSTLNPMWLDGNVRLLKSSGNIASLAGCSNETATLKSDPRSVVECLKGKPVEVLLEAQNRFLNITPNAFYLKVGGQFLPEDAISAYREGKFNKDTEVMVGTNKDEGSLFVLIALADYVGLLGKNAFKMSRNQAISLIRLALSVLNVKNPSDKISYYFNKVKKGTPHGYLKASSDLIGDFVISCGLVFGSDFLSMKGSRVYFYKFGVRNAALPTADWVGTTHGEDVQYVFGYPFFGNFTPEEMDVSKRMISRYSAFIHTGNPNIPGELPWLQYSYKVPHYLYIGQEEESIRIIPFKGCEIWRNYFKADIDSNSNGDPK